MEYIKEIAYNMGRRDEEPNELLGKKLADEQNLEGIKEIANYLNDKNKSIQSDCLKVLYQIGYANPSLIKDYLDVFIKFLDSKNNRMVWGSMIAIAGIANVDPANVIKEKNLILEKVRTGTVITNVHGVYVIINLSKTNDKYYKELKETLFSLQDECRPVDFPKRAEIMIEAIKDEDLDEFIQLLEERKPVLSAAGIKRIDGAVKKRKKVK